MPLCGPSGTSLCLRVVRGEGILFETLSPSAGAGRPERTFLIGAVGLTRSLRVQTLAAEPPLDAGSPDGHDQKPDGSQDDSAAGGYVRVVGDGQTE